MATNLEHAELRMEGGSGMHGLIRNICRKAREVLAVMAPTGGDGHGPGGALLSAGSLFTSDARRPSSDPDAYVDPFDVTRYRR